MGTRADFYVGKGEKAEWIGSYPWDGYPSGVDKAVFEATEVEQFRKAVADYLGSEKHAAQATLPEMGWPWPWEDSQTTDYAYAFDEGKVWASCFGHKWFDPLLPEADLDDNGPKEVFPNMKDRQNVTLGNRSGVIVVGF